MAVVAVIVLVLSGSWFKRDVLFGISSSSSSGCSIDDVDVVNGDDNDDNGGNMLERSNPKTSNENPIH